MPRVGGGSALLAGIIPVAPGIAGTVPLLPPLLTLPGTGGTGIRALVPPARGVVYDGSG